MSHQADTHVWRILSETDLAFGFRAENTKQRKP